MPPYTPAHQPPRWFATAFPYLLYGGALAGSVVLFATTTGGLHVLGGWVATCLVWGPVFAFFGLGHTPRKR